MRNAFPVSALMDLAYKENATIQQQVPTERLPSLLPRVRPVHEVVNVDVYVPGCPPSADTIYTVISELLAGRVPDVAVLTRFGA
jgi:NAD-reducing hydrogenase small subunit